MIKPGLHRGIEMASYLALDAVSSSLLTQFRQTPLHAQFYMTQPQADTKATMGGEAVHYAVLEPEKFGDRYALPPKGRKTNAEKAAWAAWVSENPNKVPLTQDGYNDALGMAESVRRDPEARRFLYGPGMNEVTVVWDDGGVLCKARPDRMTQPDGEGSCIVDVKTCRDASERGFAKAIAEYGYHHKAAWYIDALNRFAPMERRFIFVAVENSAPYAVALYELTDDDIGQGREDNTAALASFKECKATGFWPGYPSGVQYISLPKWAQRQSV